MCALMWLSFFLLSFSLWLFSTTTPSMSRPQSFGRTITAITSLPPGIPGPPCAQLRVKVTLLRFNARFQLPLKRQKQQSHHCNLAVRIVWWGETNPSGLLLRPRVIVNGNPSRSGVKPPGSALTNSALLNGTTCAFFPVCVPTNKMHSYLKGEYLW